MGIGPSSKETTLHHFRDPLVEAVADDPDIDFLGILVEGTPENCDHKLFTAERAGVYAEIMRADGVIVMIDSWGNSHVDFTSVIQAVGSRGIPIVGLSFVGNQASFVVTNPYMGAIIDLNKTASGIETCVVGQNTVSELDAMKAIAIIKNKIRKKNPGKRFAASESVKIRKLLKRSFHVDRVLLSGKSGVDGYSLFIDSRTPVAADNPLIKGIALDVIEPEQHHRFVNSILDVAPMAVKVMGRLGEGVTHDVTGAYFLLTGVEEGGFQPANIGSSEGILSERMLTGRRGTPGPEDVVIHIDVLLAEGEGRTRRGIQAAHVACDRILSGARSSLKELAPGGCAEKRDLWDLHRPGGMKILLIKLLSGLGCMYETCVFPNEPGGCVGGRYLMDLANMQVAMTPNEYRDGAVHSLS